MESFLAFIKKTWDLLMRLVVVAIVLGGLDYWTVKLMGRGNGVFGLIIAGYLFWYFKCRKEE